jgi:hypothetical protein
MSRGKGNVMKMRTLLIAILIMGAALLEPTGNAASAASPKILLGIYDGNQGYDMGRVAEVEQWQSKKHAVVNMFTNWCGDSKALDSLFKKQLAAIWKNGNVPMITWEPLLCGTTPDDIEVRIADGRYDPFINRWATRLVKFLSGSDRKLGTKDDRRVYIRLGHEMNGNWYPWSSAVGGNIPSDFIAMWVHVRNIFKSLGLGPSHVQWIWCVNQTDVGGFSAEEYFPGDDYVDWLAIDGFNWGTSQSWSSWQSPRECYDDMVGRLRRISRRPLALTEFAGSSLVGADNDPDLKGEWIGDFFAYAIEKGFAMVSWFNEDKETDWASSGGRFGTEITANGKHAYAEYRTAVADRTFVSSNRRNPRLLTDAQFSGWR